MSIEVKPMITYIIIAVTSLIVGIGGTLFVRPTINPDEIETSKISKQTKTEASLSSSYSNCTDVMRSGKSVGQNIMNCDPIRDAMLEKNKESTKSGKLKILKECISLKKDELENLRKLDCMKYLGIEESNGK